MITAGDDNNDFSIMTNGSIVTQHALDRETLPMYSLTITARDCAIEPEKRLSSTVQVSEEISVGGRLTFFFCSLSFFRSFILLRPN